VTWVQSAASSEDSTQRAGDQDGQSESEKADGGLKNEESEIDGGFALRWMRDDGAR
jgi:ribosomal protein L12E/L44/L45/RPP1/RPP2